MTNEFILNLCPTGMIPTKALTPHVSITPNEIAKDVDECVKRGANMAHVHARGEDGKPHYDKDIYARIIEGIRELHPDLTICVSLSGRDFSEFEKRAHCLSLKGDLRPDMGSLTLSSLNFANQASVNSPDMVRRLAEAMGEAGVKPELEVFDLGMMNYAHYLISKGSIKPPYYFNLILGNVAGAQTTAAHLAALIAEMPPDSYWCVGGIGKQQLPANVLGLTLGHGVRVGVEDNIFWDDSRSRLASNPELTQRVVDMAALMGKKPASPREVRSLLGVSPLVGMAVAAV